MPGCVAMVQPLESRGVLGRGTESFGPGAIRPCARQAVCGPLCRQHEAIRVRQAVVVARRQAERQVRP